MANVLEPEDIKWVFISSMAMKEYHHSKFLNKEFGIEMEKITPVREMGFGKPKTYYYITGQKKEYTDLETLCKDWNEIKNYDDPNSEITWVKVIRRVEKKN